MPMQECYSYYYILNSTNSKDSEEILIDFNEIKEFDELLNELPEFEPSDSVMEKIFMSI